MAATPTHSFSGYDEAQEAYFDKGWTDGLPIIPPTVEQVQRFLDYVGLAHDHVLGSVPTREVTVTALHAAINAVMAGCRVEYMPIVIAAMRGLLEEKSNLHSTSGTLTGASHALIVNGPIRNRLEINCKAGCFGPGWRANATIGRAVRLVIRNVCKSIPGFLDRATYSTAARYSFCFGENEEHSPWAPLHVERGFPQGADAVTVFSVRYMATTADVPSNRPEVILDALAQTMRRLGVLRDEWTGERQDTIVVIGLEHSRVLGRHGWTKDLMREYLWPRLKAPLGPGERDVDIGKPEALYFVAAGGEGMPEDWVLHPHRALAITRPIESPRR